MNLTLYCFRSRSGAMLYRTPNRIRVLQVLQHLKPVIDPSHLDYHKEESSYDPFLRGILHAV